MLDQYILLLYTTPLQCYSKLRPRFQCLLCLYISYPSSSPFALLRPLILFPIDTSLEELVFGLGSELGHVLRVSRIRNRAQIPRYCRYNPSFLPRLALCSVLRCSFIELPAAFGKYPTASTCRLDEEHGLFICA